MRILHLSSLYPPHSFGGAEKVVELLAVGIAAHGHTVGVAHLVPKPAAPLQRNGVEVHSLTHRNPLWIEESAKFPGLVRNLNKIATLFNIFTANDFGRLLDQYRPDIVHSHSMVELTPFMWKLARERGIPLVHTLHDYDLLCIRGALFKDGQRCDTRHLACTAFSAVKRSYHHNIDSVVGVSHSILQTHMDYGFFEHLSDVNRHVIWNPVRSSIGTLQHPPRDPATPLTFGFLGRLVPEKGIGTLLEACRLLAPDGWRLRIGGRAPKDNAALERQAAGLPVEFAGFVDPDAFLASIDVLVVPSIWLEPFGLTIVEAYAAGAKVIGADIAGIAEIVGAVDPAALFEPDDPAALASKMTALLEGTESFSVDDSTRATALARVRPEMVAEQYLSVYSSTLTKHR